METVGNILSELPNKPVLFINYLLKHILLYADTDSVITIKEGK